jgi:hypothetical protein
MTIVSTRNQRRLLKKESRKLPARLTEVPRDLWPYHDGGQMQVFRSSEFLVQVFAGPSDAVIARLSVARTRLVGHDWSDRITWDELQEIKNQCGYFDRDAVEVYPQAADVVHVANMRHLWVMADRLSFAWRVDGAAPRPRGGGAEW